VHDSGLFDNQTVTVKTSNVTTTVAKEISLTSLGSNQILRSPHLSTEAAKRFWSLRDTIYVVKREQISVSDFEGAIWTYWKGSFARVDEGDRFLSYESIGQDSHIDV